MYLLDTDILIDVQRGHEQGVDWFAGLEEIPCRVVANLKMEQLYKR